MYRVGIGYDTHQLVIGRNCVIGGIVIPYEKGLLGHSDGDVLLHAITDSILGAAGLTDIGHFFPDTEPEYKDADSKILLTQVMNIVEKKFSIVNIDSVVVCEEPKIFPHIDNIKKIISKIVKCNPNQVGIKATTAEKMNDEGAGKCITAHSVCLLKKIR